MLKLRRSAERGHANHGWLKSLHTFSFANYYDPEQMGFRSLRVINEDRIEGGSGFGAHPHRDMEIISYVVSGALEHQDSMGNKTVIRPGEVQRMSAGSGVVHSEYNHIPDKETHFFQIWILPIARGGNPGYAQKSFEEEIKSKNLVLVVSQDGREGSLKIQQDADLYVSRMKSGESLKFPLRPTRGAWLQVVSGKVKFQGHELQAGDAFSIDDTPSLEIESLETSEVLLFDLA